MACCIIDAEADGHDVDEWVSAFWCMAFEIGAYVEDQFVGAAFQFTLWNDRAVCAAIVVCLHRRHVGAGVAVQFIEVNGYIFSRAASCGIENMGGEKALVSHAGLHRNLNFLHDAGEGCPHIGGKSC